MEQHSKRGGEYQEPFTDDQRIHYHITEALREDRPIDHATARAIASQLHGGQASALHALASSGAVVDGLDRELDDWREDNETGIELEPWLDALDEYLEGRDDASPVEGWADLWPALPVAPEAPDQSEHDSGSIACEIGRHAVHASLPAEQPEADDEAARAEVLARITAAGVTTLGQVATVVDDNAEHLDDDHDEPDDFPWTDAATWSPADLALPEEQRLSADELDELFTATPDEQVGSVDELGWYGLVKHDGQPGGLILRQDEQGFRRVREAPTDDALQVRWAAIQQEYEDFYGQRDAYELATEAAGSTPSGLNPRIWVGSLSDYNNGRLHGVWLDATLDPDELYQAIQFMLRNGYTPGAEEWGIFDHDEFGGYDVGEYASIKTVSRIAQGVAEHGPAFAAWVELVGDDRDDLLTDETFHDHYHGEYDSLEDYVDDFLRETDTYERIERALDVTGQVCGGVSC